MLVKSIEKPISNRRPNLNYIGFIKFWAMLLIIKWHIFEWKTKPIDYGARMCEILFVSSGFLVGYNYYEMEFPDTFTNAFKYTYKHLRSFYPLELINIMFRVLTSNRKLNKSNIEILILNILLIKSLSRHVYIVNIYSGYSWFLSALLFCYFCTPFLLKGIQNIKRSLLLFVVVALIRIGLEEYIKKGERTINILDIHFHRGPGIRLMDFYLGMLIIPTFFKLKKILDPWGNNISLKIFCTILQLFSPLVIYKIMLKYNHILFRCYFVLIFTVFIFIFGYDYGYLSYIISTKFCKLIMSCQMEMYLLQENMNEIIDKIAKCNYCRLRADSESNYIVKTIIIFIVALLYKSFLKQPLTRILDSLVKIMQCPFK